MDWPVALHVVLWKESAKSAGCRAGRMSLLDFAFVHGRKQSSLPVRVPKTLIQASYRLERGQKTFKAFCFRSSIELA